ncbi:MAG: hypothetical protein ACR2KQ_07505 [Actinomycetota bacterium]
MRLIRKAGFSGLARATRPGEGHSGGRLVRTVALAATIMLLAGACGGGEADDQAQQPAADETALASNDAFCDAYIGVEAGVFAASAGGDPGDLEQIVATAEENAPEDLTEQVDVVVSGVRKALEKPDDSAFRSDEFGDADEELDQWVAANCGFESVDITAVEYAFEGVPPTLEAGTHTLNFKNGGEEMHEMLLIRYKDDETTIEDLMKMSDKDAQKKIEFLGASFGPPGMEDSETKEFTPGKYAILCFVPVGATDEDAAEKAKGPPHVAKGMSAEFTVE